MADKEYIEREANCKDCICYDVCFVVRHNGDDRVLRNSPCKHFRNKVDMVEVRHGVWIMTDLLDEGWMRYGCSKCGYNTDAYYSSKYDLHRYCPNCGAKMYGKGDGE